jgi:hypothetical protein
MWPLTGSRAGDADAANGRGHTPKSHDAQEEGESPIDPQEQSVADFPDHAADFGSRNESDFVDGDLRNFTQSISLRGIDLVQSYISSCLRNAAGHRGNAKLAVALWL